MQYIKTAKAAFAAANRQWPDDPDVHNVGGALYVGETRTFTEFKKAVALDEKYLAAQYNMGARYIWGHEYWKSTDALEAALENVNRAGEFQIVSLSPQTPVSEYTSSGSVKVLIQLCLGHAYRKQQRYELAEKAYRDVLYVESGNAQAAWGLTFTYREWDENTTDPEGRKIERTAKKLSRNKPSHTIAVTFARRLPLVFKKLPKQSAFSQSP